MEKYQKNREKILKRLIILLAGPLFLLLTLDKVSFSIIFAILLLAFAYLFLRKKLWLVLLCVIPGLVFGKMIFISITSGWVYEARLSELLLLLAFVVFVLDIILNDKFISLKIDKLGLILGVYSLIALASILVAVDFRLFVFGLKAVVYAFLAYFLAYNLFDKQRKVYWFLYSITATSFVLSVQVFWKFYRMGFSSDFFFNRGSIEIPIGPIATSAAILGLLAPVLLAFYFELPNANPAKPLVFAGFFAAFLAVFLTLGKGAILSLLIGLIYIFHRHKNKRLAFVLFFVWFLALAYFGFNSYFTGLLKRMQTVFVDVNTDFRISEYRIGWDLIRNHPWFGVGIGQQIHYYQEVLDQEQGNYVNNFILQMIIDFGVVGFGVLLAMIVALVKKAKTVTMSLGRDSSLAAGFTAMLLLAFSNGLVEVTFYALPYAIIFWLIVGMFARQGKEMI